MKLDPLETNLLDRLRDLPAGAGEALPHAEAIWRAQIRSRLCDLAARDLQRTGRSFYSIGSAGHGGGSLHRGYSSMCKGPSPSTSRGASS